MDKDRATLMIIQDQQVKGNNNKVMASLKEAKDLSLAMAKEPARIRIKEAKLTVKAQIKDQQDHLQVLAKDILGRATAAIQTMLKVHQAQAQAKNRAKIHKNNSNNNKVPVRVLRNRKRALKRRIIMRLSV